MAHYHNQPFSVAGKVTFFYIATVLLLSSVVALVSMFTDSTWTIWLTGIALGMIPGLLIFVRVNRSTTQILWALIDGLHAFKERDYSLRLAVTRRDELGSLAVLFNDLGEALRVESNTVYQKELILETVLQNNPTGILLVDGGNKIVFANRAARQLLYNDARLDGHSLREVLDTCPEELTEALDAGQDTLLTVNHDHKEQDTFHVSQRFFTLNMQRHTLVMIAPLTRELARQEVRIWKKTIRIISHELKNSLAPITSLLKSARMILKKPQHAHRLEGIFDTVEGRAEHLRSFIDGYARYARLPEPRREKVSWGEFLAHLQELMPFTLEGKIPVKSGFFDRGQIEQVMINLIKNAKEAGNPQDEIEVLLEEGLDGILCVQVMDRGAGMTEEETVKALLPFYSTKKEGSGLGLPLCREIMEAHHGNLRIEAREGGGTIVKCYFPAGPA